MPTPIPEKIAQFNVYVDGNKKVGVGTEVKLPAFESMSETISGAGIAGEFESATPGIFKSMKIEIPFRVPNIDAFSMANYNLSVITLRASIQSTDSSTGQITNTPLKVVISGQLINFEPGTIGVAKSADVNVILEVLYIKIDVNNINVVEFDKLNFICVINGVDVLAAVRSQI